MTSSNENDSSPVVNSSAVPSSADAAPSNEGGNKAEGREGAERGPRHPRRAGTGKHPFNKKRPFNKDRPRREGGESGGQREGGNNASAKLAPNPAESEALFASVVSGEFDAALDAPEVVEVKNPDGVNENEISHQTGAERRAQRAQRSREDEDSDAPILVSPEISSATEVEEINVVTKLSMPSRKLKIKISNELLVELEKMQINFKLN